MRGDVVWVTVPVTLVQTELSREGARRDGILWFHATHWAMAAL